MMGTVTSFSSALVLCSDDIPTILTEIVGVYLPPDPE
jgi:hypothetical protein